MLDEKALRRAEFDEESVAVTLSDGQDWFFPLPRGEFLIVSLDGDVDDSSGFGEDYDRKLAEFEQASTANDGRRFARAASALAIDLLRRNYRLELTELRGLLPWKARDAQNSEMWRHIIAVARGVAEPPRNFREVGEADAVDERPSGETPPV